MMCDRYFYNLGQFYKNTDQASGGDYFRRRLRRFILLASGLLAANSVQAQAPKSDGTGLKTAVAVDMAGSAKIGKSSTASQRLIIREAELSLYAPVDHIFDGVLTMAAHPEDGASRFEIHEAVLSSVKLIPNSKIKVGQFFLGLGRLNRVHRHDWPFTSPPKSQSEFFAEEGALDSGIEYSWLVPTDFYLELTLAVTNGWIYGSDGEGEKPRRPVTYGRIATFTSIGDGDLQIAVNHLNRRAADGRETQLSGIDAVAKWPAENYTRVLLQSEAWYQRQIPLDEPNETKAGGYFYSQYGFSQTLQAGLRVDYFTVLSLKTEDGASISNSDHALVPVLTYKPSEFSSLRLAFNYLVSSKQHHDDLIDRSIEAQAVFILGAHPAHDF